MKIWLSTEIVDNYQQWKKVPEAFVVLEDHQAELDRVMREAVKFAEEIQECYCPEDTVMKGYCLFHDAQKFLKCPEVQAWKERQKEKMK